MAYRIDEYKFWLPVAFFSLLVYMVLSSLLHLNISNYSAVQH